MAPSGGTTITRYCADNCATCTFAGQNKCDQCYRGQYVLNPSAASPQTFCTGSIICNNNGVIMLLYSPHGEKHNSLVIKYSSNKYNDRGYYVSLDVNVIVIS